MSQPEITYKYDIGTIVVVNAKLPMLCGLTSGMEKQSGKQGRIKQHGSVKDRDGNPHPSYLVEIYGYFSNYWWDEEAISPTLKLVLKEVRSV